MLTTYDSGVTKTHSSRIVPLPRLLSAAMYLYLIIAAIALIALGLGIGRQRGRHGARVNDAWLQQHRKPPARGWTFGSKGFQPSEFGVDHQKPSRSRSPGGRS